MSGYTYDKDADGVVTVTLDKPDKPVNLMDAQFGTTMDEILGRLQAEEDLSGVILASAKSTFFAGGDIALLNTLEDMPAAYELSEELKKRLRSLVRLWAVDWNLRSPAMVGLLCVERKPSLVFLRWAWACCREPVVLCDWSA